MTAPCIDFHISRNSKWPISDSCLNLIILAMSVSAEIAISHALPRLLNARLAFMRFLQSILFALLIARRLFFIVELFSKLFALFRISAIHVISIFEPFSNLPLFNHFINHQLLFIIE